MITQHIAFGPWHFSQPCSLYRTQDQGPDANCCPSALHYRIAQDPYPFHHHFHHLPGNHRANAFGSPSRNQVTGNEGHDLRDMANDDVEREDEIPRVARWRTVPLTLVST